MEIILYHSSADPRDLYKGTKLTSVSTVEAEPYYPLSVTTPVFRLKYNSSFKTINYCYVADLGRYYFVNSITLESGDAMIIYCDCDVLMSFRSDILELDCICRRNENEYNPYISDEIPTSEKATTTCYTISGNTPFEMPSSSNGVYYVLTLNGLVGEN